MINTLTAYESVIGAMHRNVKTLKAYPRILTRLEHKYLHKVFDRALFNTLCNLDLITELKYLDISNAVGNAFETNLFARIAAHSCFEILDNLNQAVGKEVRELVKSQLGPHALRDLNAQVKELNQIKKRHIAELKGIRNNLFGHRMKAGREHAEQMLQIDPRAIYDLGHRVFRLELDILSSFVELLKQL